MTDGTVEWVKVVTSGIYSPEQAAEMWTEALANDLKPSPEALKLYYDWQESRPVPLRVRYEELAIKVGERVLRLFK